MLKSQFKYCFLVWIFHNRTLNSKVNRLHERALTVVNKNYNGTFQDFLNLDKCFIVHERNLQKLTNEIYKIENYRSPILI